MTTLQQAEEAERRARKELESATKFRDFIRSAAAYAEAVGYTTFDTEIGQILIRCDADCLARQSILTEALESRQAIEFSFGDEP